MSNTDMTERYAGRRSPSWASSTVLLGTVSGASLVGLAILAVSSGELGIGNQQVVVVVAVDALIKLLFAVSLVILSRFTGRRLPGAVWGNWLISALCVPYLVLELLFKIPGLAVQVTLPGGNVLSTANLRQILSSVRPPWQGALETTLMIACLVALMVQMSVLISAVITRSPSTTVDTRQPGA